MYCTACWPINAERRSLFSFAALVNVRRGDCVNGTVEASGVGRRCTVKLAPSRQVCRHMTHFTATTTVLAQEPGDENLLEQRSRAELYAIGRSRIGVTQVVSGNIFNYHVTMPSRSPAMSPSRFTSHLFRVQPILGFQRESRPRHCPRRLVVICYCIALSNTVCRSFTYTPLLHLCLVLITWTAPTHIALLNGPCAPLSLSRRLSNNVPAPVASVARETLLQVVLFPRIPCGPHLPLASANWCFAAHVNSGLLWGRDRIALHAGRHARPHHHARASPPLRTVSPEGALPLPLVIISFCPAQACLLKLPARGTSNRILPSPDIRVRFGTQVLERHLYPSPHTGQFSLCSRSPPCLTVSPLFSAPRATSRM